VRHLQRGGGRQAGVPIQVRNAILTLARIVQDTRARGASLPVDASEALERLSGLPTLPAVTSSMPQLGVKGAGGAEPPALLWGNSLGVSFAIQAMQHLG
jgi:hypothetical protein